jgi:hypothetical protein
MKKLDKKTKKLDLGRETLASLATASLDGVAGGAARTKTWTCDPTGGFGGPL